MLTMDAQWRELELKFELPDEGWRRLLANPALERLADGPARERRLHSIYFDTADQRLHHHKISLRLRRVGNAWQQTAKAEIGVRGGVSNPLEVETDVAGPAPDLKAVKEPLRERLRDLIGENALHAQFETIVQRTSRLLIAQDGGSVELALDDGIIRAGKTEHVLREAELELKSGTAATLLAVADALFGATAFAFGEDSKAERGYRLLRGESPQPTAPEKSTSVVLAQGQSCAEAFVAACGSATRQILHNWRVTIESSDPEGPHQLRIGVRRLRSGFRAFDASIGGDELTRIDGELRELARLVGELRDLDVLAQDIVGPLAFRNAEKGGFRELQKLLLRRVRKRRSRLQRELREPRWSSLRLKLALLPHGAGWLEHTQLRETAPISVEDQARLALRKGWRRVKRQARRLDELSVPERHVLRKRLKMLRYAAEYFAPLYPTGAADRFLKRLKSMQATFGYLNDVAMAETLGDLCRAEPSSDADRDVAAGYVLGWHAARAERAGETAAIRWQQLKRSRRFWKK